MKLMFNIYIVTVKTLDFLFFLTVGNISKYLKKGCIFDAALFIDDLPPGLKAGVNVFL